MTARRRARAVTGRAAKDAPPPHLDRDGLRARLWDDPFAVAEWCEAHGLPVPLPEYRESARALRDHVAYWWAVRECPHPLFSGRPARDAWSRLGIPGPGRARMQARLKAHDIPGAWQYTDILDR